MSKVAVILPTYSGDNLLFLQKSIESILGQLYKKFVLFVVIDGKLKKEQDFFLKSICDDRLIIINIERNKGLPNALNAGIEKALSMGVDYIARMDADDIAESSRLLKQLKFLEENKDVDVLGSEAVLIDEKGNEIGYKRVIENVTFKKLLKNCELIHPTVVFRRIFFEKVGFYDLNLKKSQDYDLWLRAAKGNIVIRNIKEPLLSFRYENGLIDRRKKEQKFNIMIKRKYLKGFILYKSIFKHLVIMYMPSFLIKLILKIKIR